MKPTFGGYFEGILQLRDPSDELIAWVRARVKADGRAAITQEKKVSNGIDLYFNDQHYLQNLGHKIKEKFPGILKTSRRLHTVHKMTSKLLYRVNVLFKPLDIKRGSIIMFHGEEVEILNYGTNVQIKVLKSGEKKNVDLDRVLRAIKHAGI